MKELYRLVQECAKISLQPTESELKHVNIKQGNYWINIMHIFLN